MASNPQVSSGESLFVHGHEAARRLMGFGSTEQFKDWVRPHVQAGRVRLRRFGGARVVYKRAELEAAGDGCLAARQSV